MACYCHVGRKILEGVWILMTSLAFAFLFFFFFFLLTSARLLHCSWNSANKQMNSTFSVNSNFFIIFSFQFSVKWAVSTRTFSLRINRPQGWVGLEGDSLIGLYYLVKLKFLFWRPYMSGLQFPGIFLLWIVKSSWIHWEFNSFIFFIFLYTSNTLGLHPFLRFLLKF